MLNITEIRFSIVKFDRGFVYDDQEKKKKKKRQTYSTSIVGTKTRQLLRSSNI